MGENQWTPLGENHWPILGENPWTSIVRKMTSVCVSIAQKAVLTAFLIGPTEVRQICKLDDTGRALVRAAMLAGTSLRLGTSLAPDERAGGRLDPEAGGGYADRDAAPGGSDPVPATEGALSTTGF